MANGQRRNEEYLAASIIKQHFPGLFSQNLRYDDMPDLQDEEKSIGVEVVRNLRDNQGKAYGFLDEFSNFRENDIPKEKIAKLYKLGFEPFYSKGRLVGIRSGTYLINTNGVYSSIEKKLGKLQSGKYKIFKSNRLFVFVIKQVACFQRYQIQELVDRICELQEKKNIKFDVVYIYDAYNGEYDLWVCYLKTKLIRKYKPHN